MPYLLIGVMGAGRDAEPDHRRHGTRLGRAASRICAVVMAYVTYGGLRGTAWANTFQTLVFMTLGGVAFFWIVRSLGGLGPALDAVRAQAPELLVRGEKIPPLKLLTYTAIPLSVGMFPHIFMHWLTARSAATFSSAIVATRCASRSSGSPACCSVCWEPRISRGCRARRPARSWCG